MTAHAPVPDYDAARQAMVDSQLKPQGVNDPSVIAAMSVVRREKFVPEEQRPLAYIDHAIPLGEGRAMPAASVPGMLLTALAPMRGETALVVGAGTFGAGTGRASTTGGNSDGIARRTGRHRDRRQPRHRRRHGPRARRRRRAPATRRPPQH